MFSDSQSLLKFAYSEEYNLAYIQGSSKFKCTIRQVDILPLHRFATQFMFEVGATLENSEEMHSSDKN